MARRAEKMNPSVIRELLKITERPGIISFAGGLPSPKTFPVAAFSQACETVWRQDGQAALQYAASEAYDPLREMVAAGLPWAVRADQVLITTGSQQGLAMRAWWTRSSTSMPSASLPTATTSGSIGLKACSAPKYVGVSTRMRDPASRRRRAAAQGRGSGRGFRAGGGLLRAQPRSPHAAAVLHKRQRGADRHRNRGAGRSHPCHTWFRARQGST